MKEWIGVPTRKEQHPLARIAVMCCDWFRTDKDVSVPARPMNVACGESNHAMKVSIVHVLGTNGVHNDNMGAVAGGILAKGPEVWRDGPT